MLVINQNRDILKSMTENGHCNTWALSQRSLIEEAVQMATNATQLFDHSFASLRLIQHAHRCPFKESELPSQLKIVL